MKKKPSLILLGKLYTFNDIEKKKLQKKFVIQQIDIKKTTSQIISDLKKIDLSNSVLVINDYKLPSDIHNFLKSQNLFILTLDSFMDKYLKKIFVPYEFKNIPYIEDIKGYNQTEYIIKRIIDFIIGIPLGVISIPIILYSIYRIKKESPHGSILYKQKRIGKGNKEFVAYKFRSMIPDAEKDSPKFASKNDPRVFKWGAFMRKTRIDELPQLLNVFKGEMHLVGPRPERKFWTDQFEKQIPYYNKRHIIAPGITGWAQVNYPYGSNTEDARQKLMYDLYYIKHWSLWLEIKILLKTVFVILKKQGQ